MWGKLALQHAAEQQAQEGRSWSTPSMRAAGMQVGCTIPFAGSQLQGHSVRLTDARRIKKETKKKKTKKKKKKRKKKKKKKKIFFFFFFMWILYFFLFRTVF